MRTIVYCAFICGLILVSCNNDKNTIPECNVENPLEELAWLKDVKNSLTNCTVQTSIIQGKYKGKSVFYTMTSDPLANSAFHIILWDCNGNTVKEYKTGENNVFYNEVEFSKNLFTCTKQ